MLVKAPLLRSLRSRDRMSDRGIIIKGVGGLYSVMSGGSKHECKARGVFRKEGVTPTVGDHVSFEDGVITEILPRKNTLIRPAVSNIDKLFIVIAVANPDPDSYYIDKLTVIAEYYGIEPVLIFNKNDLDNILEVDQIYQGLPYKKYYLTANDETDVVQAGHLAGELNGCTAAFAGLSGVGKSSILNLLAKTDGSESVRAEVGKISEKLLRGKHTTRHVELFPLCGGFLADTPGFGSVEFTYFDIKDRNRLQDCFPEFSEWIGSCRFQDCHHVRDKGCAVRQAAERGDIPPERYESYCKMYESLGEYKPWEDKK